MLPVLKEMFPLCLGVLGERGGLETGVAGSSRLAEISLSSQEVPALRNTSLLPVARPRASNEDLSSRLHRIVVEQVVTFQHILQSQSFKSLQYVPFDLIGPPAEYVFLCGFVGKF